MEAVEVALAKEGDAAVFREEGYRETLLLPMLMTNTLVYLSKFRKQDPTLFGKVFAPNSKNMLNARRLLNKAEEVVKRWFETTAEIEYADSSPRIAEITFWNAYQKRKTKVLSEAE
jgi:hypothetical protein